MTNTDSVPTAPPTRASFTVAAVQATPAILDAEATLAKTVALVHQAADRGADLVVFPEAYFSLYPSAGWAYPATTWKDGAEELFLRLWESAVDVRGPIVRALTDVCRERGVHVAVGVNERVDKRPGTLYNALLVIGPDGLLLHHRKLMPTMHERVFHGQGAGDDLDVVALPDGVRVGGLICWENWMPLARWRLHEGGPQIWLAPTADDSDRWLAAMRYLATEAGAFVVSVPQFIPADAFPDDFPLALPADSPVFGRGGVCVVNPTGQVVAGPVHDREEMLVVECDLAETIAAKRYFDAAGHYSRADVLAC